MHARWRGGLAVSLCEWYHKSIVEQSWDLPKGGVEHGAADMYTWHWSTSNTYVHGHAGLRQSR